MNFSKAGVNVNGNGFGNEEDDVVDYNNDYDVFHRN